jgi:hypothetical protein
MSGAIEPDLTVVEIGHISHPWILLLGSGGWQQGTNGIAWFPDLTATVDLNRLASSPQTSYRKSVSY